MGDLSMTIDNRYRVHDLLGVGAMGRVYRATSRLTGREVALKLLREPDVGSDQGRRVSSRLALAREFQTLSSLHHPNVVRVLDYGFDREEGPFFTMELLPGAQSLYAAAATLSRTERLELLAQLARALTYLHRRGVLHRDLKPNNVLVADGEVRLVDFGIASPARGREPVAGTPGYMAPELWQGVPASVRSDLYAYGVLAVALLAGTDTPEALTLLGSSATISLRTTTMTLPPDGPSGEAVPRPAELLDEVRGDVRAVLGRLLHPEPSQRYASMEETLDALNRAAGTSFPVETPETRESLIGASSLVGREAEMEELRAALDDARAGGGAAILVGGESGVGKSRLIEELRTLALVHGTAVAVGQASAETGAPYQLWLPILRELAVRAEPTDADAGVLKAVLPDIGRLLGREIPDAPALPAAAARTRLHDAVVRLLAAQAGPTALFLEDLQWAGDDSLGLLAALTDGLHARPVLLLGTWRNDEAPDLPTRLPAARVMRVPRLVPASVAELAASILGPRGEDPDLASWLFRETEGNVFFLVEVVRELAVQAGQLDRIRPEALPDRVYTRGIDRVARRRYDSVPETDRALLALAAVAGRQLDRVVLTHAAGVPLDAWLRRCANAAVLDGTGGDWRFAHDKYREAILGRLDADARSALHRRVAEAMEALAGSHPVEAARCAWHYEEGGDPARAWVWHMRAGEAATLRCAYGEARDQFAAAIRVTEALPSDDGNRRRRVDALLRKVYTTLVADTGQLNLARMAEARELLGGVAVPTAEDRLRAARVDHATGRIHFYRGEVVQAIGYYQKVLPVAMESGDAELAALPASLIGTALLTQGQMTRAEPLLRQAIAPLERLGEPFEWFRAVGYHGASLVALGRYREGIDELRRVQARGREVGQPSLASATWLMSGSSYLFSGDWTEVLECLARVRALAPQTGDKLHLSLAWSGTAWAQGWLGRAAEAAESRAAGRAVAAEMGGRLMLGDWFEAADAELALLAGDLDGAGAKAAEVAASSGASGLLVSLVVAERVLGAVRARAGDSAGADAHFGASLTAADKGGLVLPAARTRFEWALAVRSADPARAAGLREEARGAYERAGCAYALGELDVRWAAGVAPGMVTA